MKKNMSQIMTTDSKKQLIQDKVLNELRYIPANKLSEIYDIIHYFRIGIETKQIPLKKNNIKNKSEKIFGLIEEIKRLDTFKNIQDPVQWQKDLRNEW